MKTVITFGTFDVFHVGHLRLLQRAKALGEKLVVGISTDKLSFEKKGRFPVYSERERMEIIRAIDCVDECFYEEKMEKKRKYVTDWSADLLVMGDDWLGRFDDLSSICEVFYLERTPSVSTTQIIDKIIIFGSEGGL